jgi:hypothetical protein
MARTIRTVLFDLPCDTWGFSAVDDECDIQTVVLNARFTYEDNVKTYEHEIRHEEDFDNIKNVNKLEKIRHK